MKNQIKLFLLIGFLIPQLLIVFLNFRSQMLMGNWVELLIFEFTIQTIYYYITKFQGKLVLILSGIFLIPQLLAVFVNFRSQMLMGNWVELLMLEFTIQTIYYYITKMTE